MRVLCHGLVTPPNLWPEPWALLRHKRGHWQNYRQRVAAVPVAAAGIWRVSSHHAQCGLRSALAGPRRRFAPTGPGNTAAAAGLVRRGPGGLCSGGTRGRSARFARGGPRCRPIVTAGGFGARFRGRRPGGGCTARGAGVIRTLGPCRRAAWAAGGAVIILPRRFGAIFRGRRPGGSSTARGAGVIRTLGPC